jgi:hypothetical protein
MTNAQKAQKLRSAAILIGEVLDADDADLESNDPAVQELRGVELLVLKHAYQFRFPEIMKPQPPN